MRTPSSLPEALQGRPFRVAEAVEHGVSRKRLDASDLWAPFRGMRVPVALGWGPALRARCGLVVCLPGTVVIGQHAVAAAGLPLLRPVEELMAGPLQVCPPMSFRPWSHAGIDVDEVGLPMTVPRVEVDGVLRAGDADLWARSLSGLHPLVRRGYGVHLAAAVLARTADDPSSLDASVLRLPPQARQTAWEVLEAAVAARRAG